MVQDPINIADLILKQFNGSITPEEAQYLQEWLDRDVRNVHLLHELQKEITEGEGRVVLQTFDEDRAWASIQRRRRNRTLRLWGQAAAIFALVASISLVAIRFNRSKELPRIVASKDVRFKNDVLPAIKGAKIILADGTEFKVNTNVTLYADGTIATDENKIVADLNATLLNKLVVPAANYLNIMLCDGTVVWVNARSELVFPSRFAEDQRLVKLKGEAYFQVAKDSKRPFVVETEGGNVKVLGTQFNISAYDDNPVTTLEEGKVMVYNQQIEKVLSPGMKAVIKGNNIDLSKANLQKELAWKNNSFYFSGDNIVTIAKQLQNWYDLEVTFGKDVSLSQTYTGEISRSVNLTEVLKMLDFVSELDFKIDKNKLTILNKKV